MSGKCSTMTVWLQGLTLFISLVASSLTDGQRVATSSREMGNTEVFAQSLQHSPNGRFVTVCGDGEFIIYTALAWRNKAFGPGLSFAWANDSNTYAVREAAGNIKVFRNFKERPGLITTGFKAEDVKGGTLLGVVGPGFVSFYDWETGALIRRIDVEAKDVSMIVCTGLTRLLAVADDHLAPT